MLSYFDYKFFKLYAIAICFFLIFAVGEASATDYYVSTSGSDSNPGTEALPFRYPQKGVDAASAGDTVYIKSGTYPGFHILNKSGTSSNWIVIKNYPGETVTLDIFHSKHAYDLAVIRVSGDSHYIKISGFKMTDSDPNGDSEIYWDGGVVGYSLVYGHNGLRIMDLSGELPSYIEFSGNEIYHIGSYGISTKDGVSYIEILDNIIHDVGLSKRGYGMYPHFSDSIIRGNTVYDCYGYGIHVYADDGGNSAISRNLIENNKTYNNGKVDYGKGYNIWANTPNGKPLGGGIVIGWSGADSIIRNNISYNNLMIGISVTGQKRVLVENNTVYSNGKEGIKIYKENRENIVINNTAYQNGGLGNVIVPAGNTQENNVQDVVNLQTPSPPSGFRIKN